MMDEELGQAGDDVAVSPEKSKATGGGVKKKPVWQRPLYLGLAALAVIGIALGVGLGVGLNGGDNGGGGGSGSGAAATTAGGGGSAAADSAADVLDVGAGVGAGADGESVQGEQLAEKKKNASDSSDDSPATDPTDAPPSEGGGSSGDVTTDITITTPEPSTATTDPDDPVATDPPDPLVDQESLLGGETTTLDPSDFTYVSRSTDPLPITMRTIDDPSIMSGYETCADLYDDIVNATAIYANAQILNNARYIDRWNDYYYPPGVDFIDGGDMMVVEDSIVADSAPMPAAGSSASKEPVTEDSFEANNQEAGVQEADVTKSDGKYVYMAYGDVLVVTDAETGEELSRTKMPPRKELSYEEGGCGNGGGGPYGGGPTPIGIDSAAVQPQPQQKSMWMPYNPKPRIVGLLLHPDPTNRLVVIVSGYRPNLCYSYPDKPILSDKGEVHLRVYDTSPGSIPTDGSKSELTHLGTQEMWGSYRSARSIGTIGHIVIQSGIDMYFHFAQYLDTYREEYRGKNRTEYIEAATANVEDLIPKFAERLLGELKEISNGPDEAAEECSAITKISMFASGGKSEEGWPDVATGSSGGILNSYLQVASLDMASAEFTGGSESTTTDLENVVKTSGAFFPNHYAEIYASDNVLVAAGEGYRHHPFDRSWEQTTYFLAFDLKDDGSASSGLAVGKAPGYVLNQFAMDQYLDTFRVATTVRAKWACVNQIKPQPVLINEEGEEVEVLDVTIPEPWRCDWQRVSESTSQITVLKFPPQDGSGSNVMEEVKVLDELGVTEVITSARFFDDKAYVVTFMQTDPVYTIDFSDRYDPVVTDELKITGFSSYLHPVGKDRLLAIGKEADLEGMVTGFQITLFNVTDMNNTQVIQRFTIDQRWSSSVAERDHLAFRYLPQSQLLILPISIYGYYTKVEPFDGFKIYHVDDNGIEERFNVSMADPYAIRYGCWYHATLPARSMVFGGKATFMKGHTYQSWDLTDETLRWEHNLDTGMTNENCYNYWR